MVLDRIIFSYCVICYATRRLRVKNSGAINGGFTIRFQRGNHNIIFFYDRDRDWFNLVSLTVFIEAPPIKLILVSLSIVSKY